MENPKASSKPGKGHAEPSAGATDPSTQFINTHSDYSRAHQEAIVGVQRDLSAGLRGYLERIQQIERELQVRSEESYREYEQAARTAMAQQADPTKAVQEAYAKFAGTVQQLSQDGQKRALEAYQNYTNTVQEAYINGQKNQYEALGNYLKGMQQAWAHVNVDAVVDAIAKSATTRFGS